MKKKSIIADFKNISYPGTFNQIEKTNFITGKGMDIQDSIRIRSLDIFSSNTYDQFEELKRSAIKSIILAKDQTDADKLGLAKWVIEIDTTYLLREYLYNQIYTENTNSAFNLLTNDIVANQKISQACYSYIDNNLMNRYGIKDVIFWTKFYELKFNVTPDTYQIPLLKNSPVYSFNAKPTGTSLDIDKAKSIISTKTYNNGLLELNYKQIKPSQYETFLYYYDIVFYRL
jgi:hypothetical protein